MSNQYNDGSQDHGPALPGRRKALIAGAGLIAAPLMVGLATGAWAQQATSAGNRAAPTRKLILSERRKLGPLEVSALGLGGMSMNGGQYNPPKDKAEMIRLIHIAVDFGVDFFDTART